jgi:hypothetical protein
VNITNCHTGSDDEEKKFLTLLISKGRALMLFNLHADCEWGSGRQGGEMKI